MTRVWRLVPLAGLAAAVLVAPPAFGAETPPDWLKKPTPEDLMSVWPTAAWRQGLGGKAVIGCTVTTQGALRDCRVLSETPAGAGFGAAAITLTPQFLMKPATRDGQPVASTVSIPINFTKPDIETGSHLPGSRMQAGPSIRVVSRVPWIEAPSVADVHAALRERANAAKGPGRVTLDCAFTRDGRLSACTPVTEEPKGQGFVGAARMLSTKFRGPTQDASGRSMQGVHIQVPFTFAAEALTAAAPVIGKPNWTSVPQGEDFRAAVPEAAAKAGVLKARVVLGCSVASDGGLSACQVESEEPAGLGYGAATMSLASKFRLSVWSAEGLPTVGGVVRVPIRYDFSDEAPTAKK